MLLSRAAPRALTALGGCILLGAIGCGDSPTTPETLAGRYALERAAGEPLPAEIFAGLIEDPGGDFQLRVMATTGWLELSADGGYDHGVDLAVTVDGQPQPILRWRDRGRYTLAGSTLSFESEFIENVAFEGQVEGDRIDIEQDLAGEGVVVSFMFGR